MGHNFKTSNRRDWSTGRLFAVAATVFFHLFLAHWLLTNTDADAERFIERPAPLMVQWITPIDPEPLPVIEPEPERSVSPAARVRAPRRAEPERRAALDVVDIPAEPNAPAQRAALDLRLRDNVLGDHTDFKPKLGERAPSDWPGQAPAVSLNVQDRSLAGRLRGMSRASVCAELRRAGAEAARTNSGTQMSVIAETMEKHDCR